MQNKCSDRRPVEISRFRDHHSLRAGGATGRVGILQLYQSSVPNGKVVSCPMVLGHAIVVPTLVSWNAVVAQSALSRL
jgi:hypothetical protein